MSLERDISQILEADIFKPASKREMGKRLKNAAKVIRKEEIFHKIDDALNFQFESYSWFDMIRDALQGDYTPAEVQWANDHISYRAYIYDDPDAALYNYTNESCVNEENVFKAASRKEADARRFQAGSIWVSLRTVRAKSYDEAVSKVQIGDFEEDHPICDAIVPVRELKIKGRALEEAAKNVFKPATPADLKARNADRLVKFNQNKAEYLRAPNFCPFCRSEDITAAQEFPEYGTINEEMECSACGEKWNEQYKLVDVEPLPLD